MTDFETLLAGAKRPERSVPVCLRGDLVADHEAAERELELAQRRASDSFDSGGSGEIVDRIESLENQMAACTYPFRFRALPKKDFRALVTAYPPRRDDNDEVVPFSRAASRMTRSSASE
jgi:hypothetical protein